MAEPLGRPKTLNRRHKIEIDEDTQEFIREMMDKYLKGKAIAAVGEASEGILSNPQLAFLVGGGLLAAIGASVGAEKVDLLMRYFGDASKVFGSESTAEEKRAAALDMGNILRDILPFGFLVPEL